MARYVMVDPQVEIDGVDLSDWCTSAEVQITQQDVTSMASGDDYEQHHEGGIKRAQVSIGLIASYAAGEVYATIHDHVGEIKTVKIKGDDAAASATNPEFELSCLITEFPLITGSVKELSSFSVNWPANGVTINT